MIYNMYIHIHLYNISVTNELQNTIDRLPPIAAQSATTIRNRIRNISGHALWRILVKQYIFVAFNSTRLEAVVVVVVECRIKDRGHGAVLEQIYIYTRTSSRGMDVWDLADRVAPCS